MLKAAVLAWIVAAAVSSVVSEAAARSGRRRGSPPWWSALSVGLGYAIGHACVNMPAFPPGEVTSRIPYLALIGAVVAAGQGGFAGRLIRAVGLVSLVYLVMLSPILGRGGHSRAAVGGFVGTALAALMAAGNVAMLDESGRRKELSMALIVLSIGAGILFLMARSAVLFELSMVLAASMIGGWRPLTRGRVEVALTVLSALVLESFYYASLPSQGAVLLAGAPAVLWGMQIGPLRRLGETGSTTVAAVLMILAVVAAVVVVL